MTGDAADRVRADLEAARELLAARDAQLARADRLLERLVRDTHVTRAVAAEQAWWLAQLRRVDAEPLTHWLKLGLRLLVGGDRYEAARRWLRSRRGRGPEAPPAAIAALPPLRGLLPSVDGRPLLDLLRCPRCAHAPLAEGLSAVFCPGCLEAFPLEGERPIFADAAFARLVRDGVLDARPGAEAVATALRRALAPAAGERPGAPGPDPAPALHRVAPRLALPAPAAAGATRLLFLSHNLNLEGAPLFQLWLAGGLRSGPWDVRVVAATDGPLRARYEALGIPVAVLDLLAHVDTEVEYAEAVDGLARWVRAAGVDLVFCNTLGGFWGVDVAARAGRPSVWKVHESVDWRAWVGRYPAPVARAAAGALRRADRLVFTAEATRALFRELESGARLRTIYCGLDAQAIDAFKRARPKAAARAAHGVADDAPVVTIVGTTCERKGQLDFLRVAARLRERPDRPRFYVVGARPGEYLDRLRRFATEARLDRVVFVEETPDVYDYYRMADVFVCASYEESFPLVILEAMAFDLPIVSTDVFGIPEALGDGHDALLTGPGDVPGLADRVGRLLDDPDLAAQLAATARATFDGRFTLGRMVREYERLFTEVRAGTVAGTG